MPRKLEPEFIEIVKRLKRKEPELQAIVDREDQEERHSEETETDLKTDTHD